MYKAIFAFFIFVSFLGCASNSYTSGNATVPFPNAEQIASWTDSKSGYSYAVLQRNNEGIFVRSGNNTVQSNPINALQVQHFSDLLEKAQRLQSKHGTKLVTSNADSFIDIEVDNSKALAGLKKQLEKFFN